MALARPASSVHPFVERTAAYAWRLLVIAAATAALAWLTGQLLIVVIPLVVALLIARGLAPVVRWLVDRRWPPALAALVTLAGLLILILSTLGLAGASLVAQSDDVAATVSDGIDDVQEWLVSDSPFDLSERDLAQARERVGDALGRFVQSSEGSVVSGAVLAAEIVAGLLLAAIVSFFFLKDGPRLSGSTLGILPVAKREPARRLGRRAWEALGGYLRGAILLGAIEATVMAVTLLLVGAELVVPVAVITFLAAFVPIVGAIVSGIVATLVALATAGPVAALVVAAVALVVQQLDNDLLAPVIYGRTLRLHPLVVLLGIASAGALFGLVGTLLAVPVIAVLWNVADEARTLADPSQRPDGRAALPELGSSTNRSVR
jgi:predicted PurR-regulated permease PerM